MQLLLSLLNVTTPSIPGSSTLGEGERLEPRPSPVAALVAVEATFALRIREKR
jgi:hypothetical protein